MAIAIHSSRRHVTHRPPWVRRRTTEYEAALPVLMVVLVIVGVTALILSAQMLTVTVPRSLFPTLHRAAPDRPTDGATPASKASVSTPAKRPATAQSAAAEQPASTPPPPSAVDVQTNAPAGRLAVGARARVANTENLGTVFYSAPRVGSRQPAGLLEGASVTILEVAGDEWARVQSDTRKTGWVRAEYLAPAE